MASQRPRTVVVGAGPSGLAAAYLLHQAGSKVTLIERNSKMGDSSRSFSYLLMPHGMETLRRMGISDTIKEYAASTRDMEVCNVKRDEPITGRNMNAFFAKDTPFYWISRTVLVNLMFDRVSALSSSGMDIRLSTKVTSVAFPKDGAGIVETESSIGETSHINADLVLACDGIRSVVRQSLDGEGTNSGLESRAGFGLSKRYSSSVDIRFKTLQLGPEPTITKEVKAVPWTTYVILGCLEGVEELRLGILPVSSKKDVPRFATITRKASSKVWDITDADEGYKLFEGNFPHLDLHTLIPRAEMERFVTARPGRFPPIQRVNSLVGVSHSSSGNGSSSGVAFLGDAAHAFPPDLGQGVNSALADVTLLIDALQATDTLEAGLQKYEEDRHEDIDALMEIMQTMSNAYQYGQNKFISKIISLKQIGTFLLNKFAPSIFSKSVFFLCSDHSYKDALRKSKNNARRIQLLAAAVVVVVAYIISLFSS